MNFLNTSGRVASTNNPNNQPPKRGIGIKWIVIALALGILSQTVFPAVALSCGLIDGDQYVKITTGFYESGSKVIENGTSIMPSNIPAR
ncbi:hypothetical protein [Bacillus cereus]|uniref:hypothetical protein n=1 Tax=Bacillus cereus TaxID=1396 RepID=UPI0007773B58|nr:hypothetical protein [Bacillus cereus]